MKWTFQLNAKATHLFFLRVLQVFETQRVNISSFSAETEQDRMTVTVQFESGLQKAFRIEALLHKLVGIDLIQVESHP
jgi:hypothetical protein